MLIKYYLYMFPGKILFLGKKILSGQIKDINKIQDFKNVEDKLNRYLIGIDHIVLKGS